MPRISSMVVAAVAAALTAPAKAQEVEPLTPVEPMRPLEQVVADSNVLSTSLRVLEPGLDVPTGFEQVYNVPGREDLRMRVNGGLYAVFPESAYIVSGSVAVALIPAGTVFFIGEPSSEAIRAMGRGDDTFAGEQADRAQHLRLDRRIVPLLYEPQRIERLMVPQANPETHRVARWSGPTGFVTGEIEEPTGPAPVTIVTDAAYRSRRIRELMQAAAHANSARHR
jgi:hypothetical protein